MIQVTDSIALRPLEIGDAAIIYNTIDTERDYLRVWLPFVDETTEPAFTEKVVAAMIESDDKQFIMLFNGQFAGLIGYKETDLKSKKAEIGYWLSQTAQGKGIVIQSVQYLIHIAFEELGINRVQIKVAIENKKSRKIPEKLGFQLEGVERDGELLVDGVFTDIAVYSILKREYKG